MPKRHTVSQARPQGISHRSQLPSGGCWGSIPLPEAPDSMTCPHVPTVRGLLEAGCEDILSSASSLNVPNCLGQGGDGTGLIVWSAMGQGGLGWGSAVGREHQEHRTWVKSGCRTGPAGFQPETQSRSWWESSKRSPWEGSCSTCKRHTCEKTGTAVGRAQPIWRVSRALKMWTPLDPRHKCTQVQGHPGENWKTAKCL